MNRRRSCGILVLMMGVICVAAVVCLACLLKFNALFQSTAVGPCRVCEQIRERIREGRTTDEFEPDSSFATLICRKEANLRAWGSCTPLRAAAMCADFKAMKAILNAGSDPNLRFVDLELCGYVDRTALMVLCKEFECRSVLESKECCRLLLDCGSNPDLQDWNGESALHFASWSAVLSKILVEAGADLDLTNRKGESPLHRVARDSKNAIAGAQIIALLIDAGADTTILNSRGKTALEQCNTPEKKIAFERALAKRGDRPPRGRIVPAGTPLHAALATGNKKEFSELLDGGADPNALDSAGDSVVHLAAAHEDEFWLVESLMHGGDANVMNTGNRTAAESTPVFYAIRTHRTANVRRLIDAGADVNRVDHYGSPPLFAAMLRAHYEIATILIEAGADPRLQMPNGATAMNYWDFFTESREGLIENPQLLNAYVTLKTLLKSKGYLTPKDLARPY